MRVDYALLAVVQELDALFQRHCVSPPPDQLLTVHPHGFDVSAPLQDFADIEEMLRGAGCLLANGLGRAALPVLADALGRIRTLDDSLSEQLADPVAQYYSGIASEIQSASRRSADHYWLCGEVMALYLDVLAVVRDKPELRAETQRLRRELQDCREAQPAG